MNRKGCQSINVQAMTDASYKFIDAVVKLSGSTHESFIFRFSDVKDYFDANHIEISDGLVLGDSGYPLLRYLMTPYINSRNPEEVRYNRAHKSTRCSVERAIGQMKWRFACLHSGLRVDPSEACLTISAYIVLHNIAKEMNILNLIAIMWNAKHYQKNTIRKTTMSVFLFVAISQKHYFDVEVMCFYINML